MRLTPQLPKPGPEVEQTQPGLALEAPRQDPSLVLAQSSPPQALQDQAHSQLASGLQAHYSPDDKARIGYAAARVAHKEAHQGKPEGFYVSKDGTGLAIKYLNQITELRITDLLQKFTAGHLDANGKKLCLGPISESLGYPHGQPRGQNIRPGPLRADASQHTSTYYDLMTGLPMSPDSGWAQGQGTDSRVGDVWNKLNQPIDKLAKLKQESLLPFEQTMQAMQDYKNQPKTGFWSQQAAQWAISRLAFTRGAVQILFPETPLDVGLVLAPVLGKLGSGAKGAIKGINAELSLASVKPLGSVKVSTEGWKNLPGGVRIQQAGDAWVKAVNPDANAFARWWGKGSLDTQAKGLSKLGDMSPAFAYRNGVLTIADAGPYQPGNFWVTWAKGSRRLGTPFNDIRPRNMGANGVIFDPLKHPVQSGLETITAAAVGATVVHEVVKGK